jgi:hypothetical protein
MASRGMNQPMESAIQVLGSVLRVRRSRPPPCVPIMASTAKKPKGSRVAIQMVGLRICMRSS